MIALLRPLVLPLLVVDSVLLAIVEVMFLQLYVGSVPVPISALLAAVSLPWLVSQAGKIGGTPSSAMLPLVVWLVTVGLLGFAGPGDDVLLPVSWPLVVQTVLLLVGGLVPATIALSRVRREMAEQPEGWHGEDDDPAHTDQSAAGDR